MFLCFLSLFIRVIWKEYDTLVVLKFIQLCSLNSSWTRGKTWNTESQRHMCSKVETGRRSVISPHLFIDPQTFNIIETESWSNANLKTAEWKIKWHKDWRQWRGEECRLQSTCDPWTPSVLHTMHHSRAEILYQYLGTVPLNMVICHNRCLPGLKGGVPVKPPRGFQLFQYVFIIIFILFAFTHT